MSLLNKVGGAVVVTLAVGVGGTMLGMGALRFRRGWKNMKIIQDAHGVSVYRGQTVATALETGELAA